MLVLFCTWENFDLWNNLRFLSDVTMKTLATLVWCYTLPACKLLTFFAVWVPWIRGIVMIWQMTNLSYFCNPQDFISWRRWSLGWSLSSSVVVELIVFKFPEVLKFLQENLKESVKTAWLNAYCVLERYWSTQVTAPHWKKLWFLTLIIVCIAIIDVTLLCQKCSYKSITAL